MKSSHVSIGHAAFTAQLLAVVLLFAPIVTAQTGKTKKALSLGETLALNIETRDFTNPMTMQDGLQLLYEKLSARGIPIAILVDLSAFAKENLKPYHKQVALPAVPKEMSVGDVLESFIRQNPNLNAAIVLRDGKIVITTRRAASPAALLKEKIRRRFDKVPFADAMQQISEMTGLSILVDPRLKEIPQIPIDADFRGDVPVEAALIMLTEMVEQRFVVMEGGIYVTTPSNAEVLRKQVRARQLEREKEKMKEDAM